MATDSIQALQLVDKILAEEIECLTEKDLDLLLEHKGVCVRKILPILALEVTQIKEGDSWDRKKLYGSLKLAAFFEEERAFDWIIQLHQFADELDLNKETLFVALYWAEILAATGPSDWKRLKTYIEDPDADEEIREACFEALLILVAKERLERTVLVDYFRTLYENILSGRSNDFVLVLFLVEGSISLWPGEALEEIKELFGIGCVEEELVTLLDVLDAFEGGKELALEHLKDWVSSCHILHPLVKSDDLLEDEALSLDEDEDDFSLDSYLDEIDDLDYELDGYDSEDPENLKSMTIALDPPVPSPEIASLSQKEQKKYNSLQKLLLENPEKVIEITSEMILNHPHIPALFNYLHSAFLSLDERVEAMKTLRRWVTLFPNDLLGKIEYAHYFLRRKEPEKAAELFSHIWTLQELYPEKASFHEVEYLKFFHLIGCYYVEIDDLEKAKEILQILDATSPNSFEYYHLHKNIEHQSFEDSFLDDF